MRFAKLFANGFTAPLVGATLIAVNPRIAKLALLPFLVTVIIFIAGLAFGLPFITMVVAPFSHWVLASLHLRNDAAEIILPFLIWPALALALFFFLLNITRLVASPLYGLLAERVLFRLDTSGKSQSEKWTYRQLRLTRAAIIKATIFLLLGLILGLLSFIPGLGLFTSFAFLVLLAYDVVDYALEALAWSFQRRVEFFRQHFAVFLGLGTSLGLVLLIPGLNFFVLPAAVAGAADLVRRMVDKE